LDYIFKLRLLKLIIFLFVFMSVFSLFQNNAFAEGTIIVSVSPGHADIYFQGSYVGTGYAVIGGLPSGSYYVSASASGYESGGAGVTVADGLDSPVHITLYEIIAVPTEPPPPPPTSPPVKPTQSVYTQPTVSNSYGYLYISSSPSGASVSVDGVYYGSAPLSISTLRVGNHNVDIYLDGYEPSYRSVYISPGQEASIYAELKKKQEDKFGSLEIKSVPEGATLFLDDKKVGKTPYTKDKITFGKHKVKLIKEGYKTLVEHVTIDKEKKFSQEYKLEKPVGTIDIKGGPDGAKIYLNEKEKGTVPKVIKDISPGKYLLEIKLDGYETYSKEIVVKADEVVTVKDFKLNKIPLKTPTSKPLEPTAAPTEEVEVSPTEGVEVSPTEVIEETPLPGEESEGEQFPILLILIGAIVFFIGSIIVVVIMARKKKKKAVEPEKIVFKKYKFKDIRPKSVGLIPGISDDTIEEPLIEKPVEEVAGPVSVRPVLQTEKEEQAPEESSEPSRPLYTGKQKGKRRRSFEDHIRDRAKDKTLSGKAESDYLTHVDSDLLSQELFKDYPAGKDFSGETDRKEGSFYEKPDKEIPVSKPFLEQKEQYFSREPQRPPKTFEKTVRDMKRPEPSKFLPLPERPRLDIKKPVGQSVKDLKRPAPSKFLPLPEPKDLRKSFSVPDSSDHKSSPSLIEGKKISLPAKPEKDKNDIMEKKQFQPVEREEVHSFRIDTKKSTVELENPLFERPSLNIKKPTSELEKPLSPRPSLNIKKPTSELEKPLPSRPVLDINRTTSQELARAGDVPSLHNERVKKIEPKIIEKRKELLKSFLNPGMDTEDIGLRRYSKETKDIDEKAIFGDGPYQPKKRTFKPVSADKIVKASVELDGGDYSDADEIREGEEKLMEFDERISRSKEFKAEPPEMSEDDIDTILKQVYLSPRRKEAVKVDMNLGEYELIEELSRGDLARVYKARLSHSHDVVAVKVPYEDLQNEYFVNSFSREVNKARDLDHPNIVKIYDVKTDNGFAYMVMEYLDSMTLREILKFSEKSNMGVVWTINLMLKICEGLNYLHSKGIAHKDITPENIMVSPVGDVKIMDYILMNSLEQVGPVAEDFFIGNPYYMSPEILSGTAIDERVDIYSLGVLFYELVTGFVPFSGDDPMVIMKKHREENPMPPRKIIHAIPEEIEKIILKMLAKSPRERFSSVRVVSALLSGYLTMRAADRSYLKPKPINYEKDR
jgi:tRNA A-37 threonylcarbamoyl transferase component Bud32